MALHRSTQVVRIWIWTDIWTSGTPEYGPKWAKKGPNRLKIAYWAHKSDWKAYFELDGVEQGWNTKGAFSQTVLGLLSCENGGKIGSLTPKVAKKRPKYFTRISSVTAHSARAFSPNTDVSLVN